MYFNCIRFNPKLFAEAKAKILNIGHSQMKQMFSQCLPIQYLFVCGVCHEEYEAKDSVEVEWFMLTGVAQEWSLVRGGE